MSRPASTGVPCSPRSWPGARVVDLNALAEVERLRIARPRTSSSSVMKRSRLRGRSPPSDRFSARSPRSNRWPRRTPPFCSVRPGAARCSQAIHDRAATGIVPSFESTAGPSAALMESELLAGRGAYTGALSRQIGRFDSPGNHDLPRRVGDLRSGTRTPSRPSDHLERLGGTRPIQVDVRVIAATNRDLRKGVAERTFRRISTG
jgi:hypothetical protein